MMRLGKGSAKNRRGVAAIEFAMVAPLFVIMMLGVIVYGGWFWMAHSVQSLAAEGARAAIAGLTPTERTLLAQSTIVSQATALGLDPALASTNIVSNAGRMEIEVVYNATNHPLMSLAILMPRPPALIKRSAVVQLGGY